MEPTQSGGLRSFTKPRGARHHGVARAQSSAPAQAPPTCPTGASHDAGDRGFYCCCFVFAKKKGWKRAWTTGFLLFPTQPSPPPLLLQPCGSQWLKGSGIPARRPNPPQTPAEQTCLLVCWLSRLITEKLRCPYRHQVASPLKSAFPTQIKADRACREGRTPGS